MANFTSEVIGHQKFVASVIDRSCEYDKGETDLWSTLNSFIEKRKIIFFAVSDEAQSLQDKLKKYQS